MYTRPSHSPSMQSAMQCDADGNLLLDPEDDQDSLFGSPPASPVRGRSPSPGLALPSASNSTQNVGTIALPGSQHCSELPVTPLALSLNYALNEHTQRPPAQPTIATSSGHTTPSSSRASSTGPGNRLKKKKNSKPKESTPRPPPPEIAFPDPSVPIPANFLRNQSALLGTAGLVGGIKPSNLSMHRRPPGTVASNPIVIDDDERVPHRPSRASFQPSLEKLGIDPSVLPVPSTREIMSILMGQKDTFLVLQSLLKLISETNQSQTLYLPETAPVTSFRRTPRSFQLSGSANANVAQFIPTRSQNSSAPPDAFASSIGPPSKKRRLNRVPAGAVDWDVPYPFPEGQGPEYYQTNWRRERGKQLMSQLVTLVKDAIRKAATRKYLQNEKKMPEWQQTVRARASKVVEEPKVHGHYRPSTITYGLQGEAAAAARAQVQKVLTDASNSVRVSTAASLPTLSPHLSAQASMSPTQTPQPSTPFDQLIMSILAITPGQNSAPDCGVSNTADGNAYVRTASSTPISDVSTQDPDQGLFDNWMNIIFQTFPMSAQDSSSSDNNMSSIPSQPDSSVPTPVNSDSSLFDLDSIFADMNPVDSTWYDFDILSTEESTSSTPGPSYATEQPKSSSNQDNEPVVPQEDFIIDPALLAISIPTASVASASTTSLEPPPSLSSSPIPSLSSFGDVDPSTPKSAVWDTSVLEVFTGPGEDTSVTENLVGGGYRAEGLRGQEEYLNTFIEAQAVGKGKGRNMSDSTVQASLFPTAVHSEVPRYSVASSSSSLQTSNDQRSLSKLQSSKADIMKRAAKRKKQLLTAIANIRTQLWETTIEQGVLLHMNKLCTHTA